MDDALMNALEALTRAAMASGASMFTEKYSRGEIDPFAPLGDAFGDFPRDFLTYRPSLVDDVREALQPDPMRQRSPEDIADNRSDQ